MALEWRIDTAMTDRSRKYLQGLRRILGRIVRGPGDTRRSASESAPQPQTAIFTEASASIKNSIDIAGGKWVTNFKHLGLQDTGSVVLYPDQRLKWLRKNFGDFKGKTVLELGSLEGAHTLQFEEFGCKEVIGIEANTSHFIKSLIIKNIVNRSNIKFLLGNFIGYINNCNRRFDLVSACGVLYHLTNPVELIAAAAKITDSIFIWTVVYNEDMCPQAHKNLIVGKETLTALDFQYQGYKHFYRRKDTAASQEEPAFSGGMADHAIWMEKDEVLRALRHFGFDHIEAQTNDHNPHHGQNMLILARRTAHS